MSISNPWKKQKKVEIFEREIGWRETSTKEIINFLKKDAIELNEKNVEHKVGDILFETIQLANRKGIDLEKLLEHHIISVRKRYKK